jgi:glutathione synthase
VTVRLGIVMDPIGSIKTAKDSSFAMLLAAQARGWPLFYLELADLFLRDGEVSGYGRALRVRDDPRAWFELGERETRPLAELDVILMRKDPPVDLEYLYATHLLDLAERAGTLVVNRPRALRDANEKLFAAWFPACCPPTLVTRSINRMRGFLEEHGDIILKPLDAMGGASVFRVRVDDPNRQVILEVMTAHGTRQTMAQRYIPEISEGDKRILMVDGEPVAYALARIPAPGESRGNLAAGGRGEGVALSDRDRWICAQVGPELRRRGLLFVGLDVIGDWLTEVNVTSPTCIRELDKLYGLDIAGDLMDALERRLAAGPRP